MAGDLELLVSTPAVPSTRQISTTAPLTGGGDLSANRTLGISTATTAADGAMSAADKEKLNSIAMGADVTDANSVASAGGVLIDTPAEGSLIIDTERTAEAGVHFETFWRYNTDGSLITGWILDLDEYGLAGTQHAGWLVAEVQGWDDAAELSAFYQLRAQWFTNSIGALSLLTASPVWHSEEPGGGWDPGVLVDVDSEQFIRIRLQNDAGRFMRWTGCVRWQVSPPL